MLDDSKNWSGRYTVDSLLDTNDAMFDDDSNRYLINFPQVTRLATRRINLGMKNRLCDLNYSSNQNLFDFTIIVNNQEIKASKFVLAMKSKVFSTMFEGDNWKDIREGKIEVKDIEYDTMLTFIKLLHGFELELKAPIEALKVRVASDKYGVDELIELCDNFVVDNLDEENAIETFLYANQFGLTDAKKAVIGLLKSTSVKFSTLPNVNSLDYDLCVEIIDILQLKKEENTK